MPEISDQVREAYHLVDDWFLKNVSSYQIHWGPRDVYFISSGQSAPWNDLSDFDEWLSDVDGTYRTEEIDNESILTVKLPLVPPAAQRYALHALLFLATLFTTIACGGFGHIGVIESQGHLSAAIGEMWGSAPGIHTDALRIFLADALAFALPFLFILTVHEFGHYFAARHHGVQSTLPFYLPTPIGIGSLGAVIALRSPLLNRRTVFDVGVAGPLAGFFVALPILLYGISVSEVRPTGPFTELQEGHSLLYAGAILFLKGPIPDGHDIFMHPLAWAGWLGMFITALNLIPIGQLDGGHVTYSMFGNLHRKISRLAFLGLVMLCVINHGFVLFALLLYFMVGMDHPPAVDDRRPLDDFRLALGWLTILIFILTFVPVPLEMIEL